MAARDLPICMYCEEVECDLILDVAVIDPDAEEMPLCNDCLRTMFEAAFDNRSRNDGTEIGTLH